MKKTKRLRREVARQEILITNLSNECDSKARLIFNLLDLSKRQDDRIRKLKGE